MKRESARKWAVVASLAMAATLLTPTLAQRPGPGRGGPHGPHDGMRQMLDRLDLSQDQRDEVRSLAERHRDETQELREQVAERRLELFDRIHAEKIDETAIRDAALAVAGAEAEIAVARAELLQEVRQLLTPEQREQARQMMSRHRAHLGKGRGFEGPGAWQ